MADPQLELTFIPASDEPEISNPEYQKGLRSFMDELYSQGIEVHSFEDLRESAINSGWAYGVFTLASTLGPVAIVQLRKAVETFLKAREGRRLKVKIGAVTVEGTASEVAKLITPEQIAKMLDAQGTPRRRPCMTELITTGPSSLQIPQIIGRAGERACWRFLEFFTVNIRNANTRSAYTRAASQFLRWCEERGISELAAIKHVHVAGYIEQLKGERSAPTVKQHLACLRMLFDWLVTGQILPTNPAHSVRGPRHSVSKGATAIISFQKEDISDRSARAFQRMPNREFHGLQVKPSQSIFVETVENLIAKFVMEHEQPQSRLQVPCGDLRSHAQT